MQRAGRAARGTGRVGEFIWFHPVWCKSERAPPPPTRRARGSGLRQVMSIKDVEDKTDSETKINEEEKATQAKKKQVNKKTLVQQRVRLDDSLWRIVNEPGCICTIVLKAFDEPNTNGPARHQYKTGCCSHCSLSKGSTTWIDTCRRPCPPKPRAKAPPHVRKAVEAALITWRAKKRAVEFPPNCVLTQGGSWDVFLHIRVIREMTQNMHLVSE